MDPTLAKVTVAALLHDIGKFADREALGVSEPYMRSHADLYQPFRQDIGRHTHPHAVYTAAFLEKFSDWLPSEFSSREWGEGEPLINLAAGHHRPEDSPLRWIVAEADRLSSGWERPRMEEEGEPEVEWRDYQKTRLTPLLAQLSLQGGRPPTSLGYQLAELSPASIFPRPLEEVTPPGREEAKEEYLRLFAGFREGLARLAHRQESLWLWLEHFDSLLLVFTAQIPALRAGRVEASRDVSLYDHARTTAALAAALYLYHRDQDSLTVQAIRDPAGKKFLFISGDFYGIQDFISSAGGEARRYRAKLLRGRSFAVSLFSELAADLVCRRLGLPFLSVVLNAAGKFTILAPNTASARQAVREAEAEINDWLFEVSLGESALGLARREASPEDLLERRFVELWEKIGQDLERKKLARLDLTRYGGAKTDYLDQFRTDLPGPPVCQLCGKRPASPEVRGDPLIKQVASACRVCRDHVFLGTNLVKRNRLAITAAEADLWDPDSRLREPIFGRYQVAFVDGFLRSLARAGHLHKLWDISLDPQGRLTPEVTLRFLNGYVPVYEEEDRYDDRLVGLENGWEPGDPKTLNALARLALRHTDRKLQGLEALGILQADVDNLGLLLTCGLPEEKFTLSRLATLSRQLHFFFCLHLPHRLMTDSRFRNIYTVFAGGDDLFLMGPWNGIIALAREIRKQFAAYVGGNPEIHLSAGISLQKPHTPLNQLASSAKSALKEAKVAEAAKNRLALFGEVVPWDQVAELQAVHDALADWLEKGWFTVAMLYRLNELIGLAAQEKRLTRGPAHLDDLACFKWRSHLAYFTARNVARGLKGEAREEVMNHVQAKLALWLDTYGGALRLPLWELLYERRRT